MLNRVMKNLADVGDRLPYVAGPAVLLMALSYPDHMALFWAALSLLLMVLAGFFLRRFRR